MIGRKIVFLVKQAVHVELLGWDREAADGPPSRSSLPTVSAIAIPRALSTAANDDASRSLLPRLPAGNLFLIDRSRNDVLWRRIERQRIEEAKFASEVSVAGAPKNS
jgi:hypothetical protein